MSSTYHGTKSEHNILRGEALDLHLQPTEKSKTEDATADAEPLHDACCAIVLRNANAPVLAATVIAANRDRMPRIVVQPISLCT
jgi:hypothetical protein